MPLLTSSLGDGPVNRSFAQRGIFRFDVAAQFVEALRYGRTSEPNEPLSVFRENRGTCTLKHALLKRAAEESAAEGVELMLGVFEMSDRTTPGIRHVLDSYGLTCVPEAHCFLSIQGDRFDFTGIRAGAESPFAHLVAEEALPVDIVIREKGERHRAVVKSWAEARNLGPAFVWEAMEACIAELMRRAG